MKNDILKTILNKSTQYIKKAYVKDSISRNYVLFGLLIVFIVSSLFSYGSTLKKKKTRSYRLLCFE